MPVSADAELTLEEVFRAARAVKPQFTAIMNEIITDAGLIPEQQVSYNGRSVLILSGRCLMWGVDTVRSTALSALPDP